MPAALRTCDSVLCETVPCALGMKAENVRRFPPLLHDRIHSLGFRFCGTSGAWVREVRSTQIGADCIEQRLHVKCNDKLFFSGSLAVELRVLR